MRDDLRKDLKKLTSSQEEVLYGCYQSTTDETGYDVENILFYNVDSSAFSHLKVSEIRFEKIIDIIKSSPVKFGENLFPVILFIKSFLGRSRILIGRRTRYLQVGRI